MNFNYLKVITGRRFPIEYVAPPVCEGEFSSTSSPFISLLPILKESIETFEATFQDGTFTFRWDHVDGALCYSVWRLMETDEWEIVAECINTVEWETNVVGCYRVTVISEEGESEPSKKVCTIEAFTCPTFIVSLPTAVSVAEGTSVTLTVTAVTTPASTLNYVWSKDGVIFLSEVLPSGTPSSVFKSDLVPGADEGLYSVTVKDTEHDCDPITCNCPLTVEPFVPPGCEDIGADAPEGTEAFRIPLYPGDHAVFPGLPIPVEWEFFDASAATLLDERSCPADPPSDPPIVYGRRGAVSDTDHPPGAYGVAYVMGWFIRGNLLVCSGTPALPIECEVMFIALEDDEFFLTCANAYSQTAGLSEQWGVSFPPFGTLPPAGGLGEGWSVCSSNGITGVQAYFDSVFLDNLATGPWYHCPVNWHTNTGGNFRFVTVFDPLVDTNAITFQVMQFDGCIQQPRGLQFNNWAAVKAGFPADVQTWAGTFPTRSVYDYTTLQWDALSGGHTVIYSQTHPTATNGCGWIVDVYGAGGFHWRGLKKTGDTGDGIYLRDIDFGAGPTCALIEEIPVVT